MISNSTIRGIENTFDSTGGLVWNRLHSDREDICEAMLKESPRQLASPPEVLQSRLRKIDDALDRLFAGSYGHCSKCGKQIENLEIDPALAFCDDCREVQVTS